MTAGIRLKSMIAAALGWTGQIEKRIAGRAASHFLILMYHRILPRRETGFGIQAGMYVEPKTFEMHIRFLKDHFQAIPMTDLARLFHPASDLPKQAPVCIVTFDDGWSDFYEYAYPILVSHGIPATVFLTTGFIGSKSRFWTDILTEMVYRRERSGDGRRKKPDPPHAVIGLLEQGGRSAESRLERSIESMKRLPSTEIEQILSVLSERWGIDPAFRGRDFLTWSEIREMHRSGLVSFGSHTETHRILTTSTDEEIEWELLRSKDRLIAEGVADASFLPFAYPNGDYNGSVIRLVKKHQYGLAVTTRKGWVPLADRDGAFELKRIGIHQDMASTRSMFGCRILQVV